MGELGTIYIIDVAREPGDRGAQIVEIAEGMGFRTRCAGRRDTPPADEKYDGVLVHETDFELAPEPLRRWLRTANVPVVHYSGGRISFQQAANHYSFPWLLDRDSELSGDLKEKIREVLAWLSGRREGPPEFLRPTDDLLAPLLAFGVLLDGFPITYPGDTSSWFKPAIDAALAASPPRGNPVDSEEYWKELRECRPAGERIREMLDEPAIAPPGFGDVMTRTYELGWARESTPGDSSANAAIAHAVYERACKAVKAMWDSMKSGAPLGDTGNLRALVEAGSVGFRLLAAGHL